MQCDFVPRVNIRFLPDWNILLGDMWSALLEKEGERDSWVTKRTLFERDFCRGFIIDSLAHKPGPSPGCCTMLLTSYSFGANLRKWSKMTREGIFPHHFGNTIFKAIYMEKKNIFSLYFSICRLVYLSALGQIYESALNIPERYSHF